MIAALAAPTFAQDTPKAQVLTRDEQVKRLFKYLRGEYQVLLKSKDWVVRGLAVVSMARLPGTQTNDLLLSVLNNDPELAVRMLAWQALLAQADTMNEGDLRALVKGTWPLADKGAFNGELRVSLLRVMATFPPDTRAKQTFQRIFANTNSQNPEDTATIYELGRTLAAWKSPDLAEGLIQRLEVLDDAWRAEMVLRAAGADPAPAENRHNLGSTKMWAEAQKDYADWWTKTRSTWQEKKTATEEDWRKLPPQFIATSTPMDRVDPKDPGWRKDLELRRPHINNVDVGFVVDATGSMQPVLDWLRADLKRQMRAMAMICREPRIGITFYRDHGDEFLVKSVPLTGNVNPLIDALGVIKAKGGGDVPEAVLDGLKECVAVNPWAQSKANRKVIVLVGDAPPHEATQADCEKLVTQLVEKGFSLYVVKARTPYGSPHLAAFDRLAVVAKSKPVEMNVREGAGSQVLSQVLVDLINPQFADRVEPLAYTVIAMLTESWPEKREKFKEIKSDTAERGPGQRTPTKPAKPFDPQAR